LVNNSENYTYNRLAKKFAGLQPSAVAQNQINNTIANPENLNSIQSKIQNAQQSIQGQQESSSNPVSVGEH
jgi:hypothetical protein